MYLGCYIGIIDDDDDDNDNANNDDENESTKNSNCNMAKMNIVLYLWWIFKILFLFYEMKLFYKAYNKKHL